MSAAAEETILYHIADSVLLKRADLSDWIVENSSLTWSDVDEAFGSLLDKGLIVQSTAEHNEASLSRWRSEPLPVNWTVFIESHPGDLELTEAGFYVCKSSVPWSPRSGYNASSPVRIRVFGETPEACHGATSKILRYIEVYAKGWAPGSGRAGSIQKLGPWWHSRFELVDSGFEIVITNADV